MILLIYWFQLWLEVNVRGNLFIIHIPAIAHWCCGLTESHVCRCTLVLLRKPAWSQLTDVCTHVLPPQPAMQKHPVFLFLHGSSHTTAALLAATGISLTPPAFTRVPSMINGTWLSLRDAVLALGLWSDYFFPFLGGWAHKSLSLLWKSLCLILLTENQ